MIVSFDNDAGVGFVKVHEELAVIHCPQIHSGVNNKQPTMNSFYSLFTTIATPRMNSGGSNGSFYLLLHFYNTGRLSLTPRLNVQHIDTG